MSKIIVFLTIVCLRIFYQPSNAQPGIAPFTSPLKTSTENSTPPKFIRFDAKISGKTVILNWVIDKNEAIELFEIEKSIGGKTFKLCALVFSSDRTAEGSYQFYEKAGNQKIKYRIKLVNKDRKSEYSAIVEINPKT